MNTWLSWLDPFARRHPRIMLLAVIGAGILALLVLLRQIDGTVVLYQAY